MHREHRKLLRQLVTIEAYQDSDGFGGPGFAAGVEYAARVRATQRMVRSPDGEERVSSTVVTLPGPPEGPAAVDPRSRVTLPGGAKPPILAVESYPDEAGVIDHFKLRLA